MMVVVMLGSPNSLKSRSDRSMIFSRVRRGAFCSMTYFLSDIQSAMLFYRLVSIFSEDCILLLADRRKCIAEMIVNTSPRQHAGRCLKARPSRRCYKMERRAAPGVNRSNASYFKRSACQIFLRNVPIPLAWRFAPPLSTMSVVVAAAR